MSTTLESARCPQCGEPIPAEAPQGLCPKCLLLQASIPTETGAGHRERSAPPAIHELVLAFPNLQILELIGQGGMGCVFKARQPKLERLVALKILSRSLASDPAFAERFTREGRVLARLNHPNIVTLFDFGEAGGFYFLLMEFVDGVNLRQALRAGRFTPEQALAVVPKICDALQYAHNEGILHRDIKPENILLDSKGRVKIADFGIAKLTGESTATDGLTVSGASLGTPHYMAPEQIERPATVDHRADIYSLGVVFYEMLTGELPLGRFAPPSEKSQSDPRLDQVVFSALDKEPSRRQASASAVKTQLDTIAANPPPTAATATEPNPWRKGLPIVLWAVVAQLAAAILFLIPSYIVYWDRAPGLQAMVARSLTGGMVCFIGGALCYLIFGKRVVDRRTRLLVLSSIPIFFVFAFVMINFLIRRPAYQPNGYSPTLQVNPIEPLPAPPQLVTNELSAAVDAFHAPPEAGPPLTEKVLQARSVETSLAGEGPKYPIVTLYTDSPMLPGETVRAWLQMPDATMELASTTQTTFRRSSGVTTSTAFSWQFPSSTKPGTFEMAAQEYLRSATENPVRLVQNSMVRVFLVSDRKGNTYQGFLKYEFQQPAEGTPDPAHVQVTQALDFSLFYSATVPIGYALQAVIAGGDDSDSTVTTISRSRYGAQQHCAWSIISRMDDEARLAAKSKLASLRNIGPIPISFGQPFTAFAVTNRNGVVYRGSLELVRQDGVVKP